MKKFFAFFAAIFFTPFFLLFAQSDFSPTQSVTPHEIYAGDVASLRYVFKNQKGIFPPDLTEAEIPVKNLPYNNADFTIKNAKFFQNVTECSVTLQFVPWRPGKIELPPFDLFSALNLNENSRAKNFSYEISFLPVSVNSILEKTGENKIRSPLSPLLVPGTTYAIFGFAVFFLFSLFLIFKVILKFAQIKSQFKNMRLRFLRKKNAARSSKKIAALLKAKSSDQEFCEGLQKIVREYLAFRFDFPFFSVSARSMQNAFEKICLSQIPVRVQNCVDDLIQIFIRADYVRFAKGSLAEKQISQNEIPNENLAKLFFGERNSFCEKILFAIKNFEKDEEEENEI